MSKVKAVSIALIVILCSLFFTACALRQENADVPESITAAPTIEATVEPTAYITPSPSPSPEPTPTPSPTEAPTPTPSPTPAPTPDIVITKHPNNDPGIIEGNTQISIARAENGDLIHWQFTPADESNVYTDQELESVFPVKVYKIDAETLWIVSIPLSMDGYKVRAVFANDHCEVYSDWATIHVIGFFTQIPHTYTFSSGVGAWSTVVTLNDDGSFTGFFHDWSANGPDGIQGYQVECKFSGQFGRVGKIADRIYTMELLSIVQEGTQGERFVDERGMTHEVSSPYGFDNASLFYVYTPGIAVDDLQESFRNWTLNANSWAHLYDLSSNTYESYGLYNYYGQQGFFQTPG